MKMTRAMMSAAAAGLTLMAIAPAQVASASTQGMRDETLHEVLASFELSETQRQTIEGYVDALSPQEKDAALADPLSLIRVAPTESEVAEVVGVGSRRDSRLASVRTLQVKNTQDAKIGGVTVATFNLTYTYEADAKDVVRNLECTGSVSGVVSASSDANDYVSQGRGTCSVRTDVSVIIKGFPVQFTKVHAVTTRAGNPGRIDGSIRSE